MKEITQQQHAAVMALIGSFDPSESSLKSENAALRARVVALESSISGFDVAVSHSLRAYESVMDKHKKEDNQFQLLLCESQMTMLKNAVELLKHECTSCNLDYDKIVEF